MDKQQVVGFAVMTLMNAKDETEAWKTIKEAYLFSDSSDLSEGGMINFHRAIVARLHEILFAYRSGIIGHA